MEHLDPDEEDEDGEVSASTAARNKAINALLGGSSPKNNAETDDEESDGEERAGGGIAGRGFMKGKSCLTSLLEFFADYILKVDNGDPADM
eukprot:g29985.t1